MAETPTPDDPNYHGPQYNAPLAPLCKVAVVLAHGGAKEVMDRHWTNWIKTFDFIYVITPVDDPLPGSITCGVSCHHGRGSIDRMQLAVAMAARFNYAVVMEYDTLVWNLGPIPPGAEIQCSRVFQNGDPQFSAPWFGHSPWVGTGESFWRILQAWKDDQGGWPDRSFSWAAQRAGIKLTELRESFSFDAMWDQIVVENALAARKRGAQAVHGFKSAETFELLEDIARDNKCHFEPGYQGYKGIKIV